MVLRLLRGVRGGAGALGTGGGGGHDGLPQKQIPAYSKELSPSAWHCIPEAEEHTERSQEEVWSLPNTLLKLRQGPMGRVARRQSGFEFCGSSAACYSL